MSTQTKIKKDPASYSITMSREFKAPLEMTWNAFTDDRMLAQWWSPAPWKIQTKAMDFKEGGQWLYAMVGPKGEKHWSTMKFIAVNRYERFQTEDFFCDESGKPLADMPSGKGEAVFTRTKTGTIVDYTLKYPSAQGYTQILEMGYEEGMNQCLDQLEQLFTKHK